MLRIARIVLDVIIVLNWAIMVLFAVALALSVHFQPLLAQRLAGERPVEVGLTVLDSLRLIVVIGMIAVVPANVIFSRLRAIVRTAELGDPFSAENSRRLSAIAWALLALQLLDLGFGGLTLWLRDQTGFFVGWSFSVGGWIAVLMLFVLARVFRTGTRMRDDLEMTV